MVEKLKNEITVTLPRRSWNRIRGALIAMKDDTPYLYEDEIEEIIFGLEVALQKTPNWKKPEGRERQ